MGLFTMCERSTLSKHSTFLFQQMGLFSTTRRRSALTKHSNFLFSKWGSSSWYRDAALIPSILTSFSANGTVQHNVPTQRTYQAIQLLFQPTGLFSTMCGRSALTKPFHFFFSKRYCSAQCADAAHLPGVFSGRSGAGRVVRNGRTRPRKARSTLHDTQDQQRDRLDLRDTPCKRKRKRKREEEEEKVMTGAVKREKRMIKKERKKERGLTSKIDFWQWNHKRWTKSRIGL